VQKKTHLVKPFIVCSADGYIINIYGFFEATKNDASILTEILKQDKDLCAIFQLNDIILVDRGFRGCLDELKSSYKLIHYMSSTIKAGDKTAEHI
jgi:hypothetical protein